MYCFLHNSVSIIKSQNPPNCNHPIYMAVTCVTMIGLKNYQFQSLLFAINLDFCVLVLHSAQVMRISFSCMWYCFFFLFKNLKKAIKHTYTPIKYNFEFLKKALNPPIRGFRIHPIGLPDRTLRSDHPIGSSDRIIRLDHSIGPSYPKGFSSLNPPLCQLSL